MSHKPDRVPPTPSTAEDLKKRRRGVLATSPMGETYRLRPINLERHALSGGLPAQLRELAIGGRSAIDKLLAVDRDEDGDVIERPETDEDRETKAEILKYLDGIVRQVVIEPELPADEDLDEFIFPADYKWLVGVAMGEVDEDGEGRRLWGREPLSRFATFRDFHGCSEDCASCRRLQDFFSAALFGSLGAVSH